MNVICHVLSAQKVKPISHEEIAPNVNVINLIVAVVIMLFYKLPKWQ
jgi:hypothetical protein